MAFGFDDLIVPAFSAVASLFGGQQRNDAQVQQAASANAFSAQQFATRYQTTVKDMEAAGLNPMLAYSQGGGSPPTGQQGQMQDVATPAVGAGIQAYSAGKIASAQADLLNAQADAASAQAAKTRAETPYVAGQAEADIGAKTSSAELNRAQLAQVSAGVDKVRAEIDKLKGETNFSVQQDILRQMAWKLHQEGAFAQESAQTAGQQRAVQNATVAKIAEEIKLLGLDVQAAEALGNIGREAGQLKPIVDLLRVFLRSR